MKRLIAIILTIVIVICCALCTMSTAVYKEDNHFKEIYPELFELDGKGEKYPTIIFPGINHSPYYVADENGNELYDKNGNPLEGSLLLLNTDSLVKNIIKIVPNLLLSFIFQKDLALTKKLRPLISDLMKYMETDETGVPKYNLVTKKFSTSVQEMREEDRKFFYHMLPVEPLADVYGEENLYLYTFPLFGNPMDCVNDIDSFIETILEKTGAEKVNIASISLGGTMLSAYLEEGKNLGKINKIVNLVSLLNGTDIFADLIDRKFNFSDEFIHYEFFPILFEATNNDSGLGHLVNILLRFIPKKLFNSIVSSAYDALHGTVVVNNPEFWAGVPSERYEEIADARISNPTLRAKTDRFQKARLNLKKNLLALSKNGVEVFNICGCDLLYTDGDYSFFGIVASNETANGDGIIPIQSTSLGATAVRAGTCFDEAYLAAQNSKYISPSKNVDASTCLFPDTTWFFIGQHHEVGRADVVIRLVTAILNGSIESIDSSELFPQFNFSRNTRSLVAENGYIDTAFEVLSSGSLDEASAHELRAALDEAVMMLNNTRIDQEKAESASRKLEQALIKVGLKTAPKKEFKLSSIPCMDSLDEFLFRKLSGKGFSEMLK